MDTGYWQLFWTTGMPEAWLMSRGGEDPGTSQAQKPEGVPEPDGQAGLPGGTPAGPGGFH